MLAKILFVLNIVAALQSDAKYLTNSSRPIIIAHRGSGKFPEHTEQAYSGAHFENADFVELDLQVTKDGHLVMSYEPALKKLTNIEDHPEFAKRKSSHKFGFPYFTEIKDDYFIHDFTLAELKSLRVNQRFKTRNQMFNGQYQLMTLSETINHMLKLNKDYPINFIRSHPTGLYIEPKYYEYYKKHFKKDVVDMLLQTLKEHGLDSISKS